ncbi:Valacyclovir hydrolase [Harpegnathos saltator]|uniref:Valacyclovir hydrolase n=1 Tax=Harpegnathos saltator TaxID=610380 RepID=E2BTB0_HARSA|nr:Valacyclovir hydrolase [Harpegnathos saltator]
MCTKIFSCSMRAFCKFVMPKPMFSYNRQLSSMTTKSRQIEEQKVKINGIDINYAKVGTGDHPVLLLPGALAVQTKRTGLLPHLITNSILSCFDTAAIYWFQSLGYKPLLYLLRNRGTTPHKLAASTLSRTIWTDFKPQIENLDADKLVIVAWDPPGYGKSRPPDKMFPDDFFQRDAVLAHDLMKTLGYKKFSLIGWSDGGITSLLLASTYPESIWKMVVTGANAYIHPDEMKLYEKVRSIDTWSEKMRTPMIKAYGEDYFRKTWSDWIDAMHKLYEKRNGDVCKQVLPKIRCPTLIVYGAKDMMVLPEHSEYLKQNIANSKLHIFEKGAHNLHLRYADEFNKLVTDFLLEKSKI